MQRINTTNLVGLQSDLTTLPKSFANISEAWANDATLAKLQIDHVRINPLQAEQHATKVRGVTVVQSSDVPVGKIQIVAIMPF